MTTALTLPESLVDGAYRALVATNLEEKLWFTNQTAQLWSERRLSLTRGERRTPPYGRVARKNRT